MKYLIAVLVMVFAVPAWGHDPDRDIHWTDIQQLMWNLDNRCPHTLAPTWEGAYQWVWLPDLAECLKNVPEKWLDLISPQAPHDNTLYDGRAYPR